jgi:redox-sensitive bicupin YhaK (pirin superfamily)
MTAGKGIAHAERSPERNSKQLHGVQLWVALPFDHRDTAALFEHVPEVPECELPGGIVRVFAGAMRDVEAGTTHFSPLVGADIEVHAGGRVEVPLDVGFEHAVMLLEGGAGLEGEALHPQALHYLGRARSSIEVESRGGARVLLIGGPPLPRPILMWWNFVGYTREEIARARADWQQHRRFGEVAAYKGQRMYAPDLSQPARANPMS